MDSGIMNEVYYGNTVADYLWLVGAILAGFIFMRYLSKLLSSVLFKWISKLSTDVKSEQFHELLSKPLSWFIMLVIIYVSSSHINYPTEWDLAPRSEWGIRLFTYKTYLLFMICTIGWIISRVIDFLGLVLLARADKTESKQDDQLIPFLIDAAKIILWIMVTFYVLNSVFGVNIKSLLAGLGIGGLALALAAKESLENLLGSFTIFFDKPFLVGDTVKVDGVMGTVEKVGFRSTRLRTPEKSYLTIPNKKMISSDLDNMSLRTFRRSKFQVGLVYGTTEAQIRAICEQIQKVLDDHPNTNMDGSVKFTDFGASSLDITVNYYVDTMDFGVYLGVKEEINFKIMQIVETNGSDFAFPSQTVYVNKSGE